MADSQNNAQPANAGQEQIPKGMKTCRKCGRLVAKSAKQCPNCGAKLKRPVWLIVVIVVIVLVIIGIAGGSGGDESSSGSASGSASASAAVSEPAREYTVVTIEQLHDDLEANAMNAKNIYEDSYVEFTGVLDVIDASGDYVSVTNGEELASLEGYSVHCTIGPNDDAKAAVAGMVSGDPVVVRGKMSTVGEIMGYMLDVDEISKR